MFCISILTRIPLVVGIDIDEVNNYSLYSAKHYVQQRCTYVQYAQHINSHCCESCILWQYSLSFDNCILVLFIFTCKLNSCIILLGGGACGTSQASPLEAGSGDTRWGRGHARYGTPQVWCCLQGWSCTGEHVPSCQVGIEVMVTYYLPEQVVV